jgi:hypothetical protein
MANRRIQPRLVIAWSVAATIIALGCAGLADPNGVKRFVGAYDVTTTLHEYSSLGGLPTPDNPYPRTSGPSGAATTYGTMIVRDTGGAALAATLTMHESSCVNPTSSCEPAVEVFRGTMSVIPDSNQVRVDALGAFAAVTLFPGATVGDSITGTFAWYLGFGPGNSIFEGTYVARRRRQWSAWDW